MPDRGKALTALAAQRLGRRHGVGGAAVVVVIGREKDRRDRRRLLL